jgi:hypothetical protein
MVPCSTLVRRLHLLFRQRIHADLVVAVLREILEMTEEGTRDPSLVLSRRDAVAAREHPLTTTLDSVGCLEACVRASVAAPPTGRRGPRLR